MTPLTYRIDGPPGAPLLVLSNSLGTAWDMWDRQLPRLRQHFRVLRYDHRDPGQTPAGPGRGTIADLAGDVLELLDRLGEPRASVCGLALGGAVALWLAAHAPERIDRIVVAGIGPDQTAAAGAVTAPTLILAGSDDPVTPPSAAFDLQRRIPGSSLLVLAGAAHLANIEQPERFTTAVLDHLLGPASERGERTRREVLGDAHVDRARAGATGFTAAFQDLITRYAWGEIWPRPGLDRATRSCITLAMLTALGRLDELALHVAAARRNGLTDDQIGEVLLQSAVYCGVPAANAAFAVARRVLEEQTHRGS